jgi:hypothetical protein
MMELKFTNSVVIGRVSWSETPQCNPRSDGVLWIISSKYGLEHLMDNVVDSTGVDMQAYEVDMHEAT